MTSYRVQRSYRATRDGRILGPWQEGDIVELSDEEAEWVARDSPGTLKTGERQQKSSADRQQRGSRNRGGGS